MESYRRGELVFDVSDSGPRDARPVVLLHGFPQSRRMWERVTPLLNDRGLRTIAPDQRGYSPGARPRRRFDYRLRELVADVVALIDEVGGRADLVAHDWGSVVAWMTAAWHPNKVRSLVALSVPHPAAFLRALLTSRQFLASWYMYFFQLPAVPEAVLSRDLAERLVTSGLERPLAERDAAFLGDRDALRAAVSWYRAMPFTPPGRLMAPVSAPTLLLWGQGDAYVTRAAVDRCAEHVSGEYRLEVLPDAGHWIAEERPDRTATLIAEHLAVHPE